MYWVTSRMTISDTTSEKAMCAPFPYAQRLGPILTMRMQ